MKLVGLLTVVSVLSVMASALVNATSTARAQTPSAAAGSMSVAARIPATSGTSVTVEALDPVTLRGVKCSTAQSSPVSGGAAAATSSQFAVVVNKSSCVEGHSANLRVCWSADECSAFFYEDGKSVDLGLAFVESRAAHAQYGRWRERRSRSCR